MTPTERSAEDVEDILELVTDFVLELPELARFPLAVRIDLANGVRRDVARRLARDLTAHVS